MITDKEIQAYWNWYDWYIIRWNLVSFFGFPLLPFAYILKYKFNVKGLWLLNDTVDGDFGSAKELKKAGRTVGRTLSNFIWWWLRNHSRNFVEKFKPEWSDGEVEDFRVIKSTVFKAGTEIEQLKKIRFVWCTKDGIHGLHYIAYRVNGKVECRYSAANDKFEKSMGSGGNEYRLRIKNPLYILKKMFLNQ
jgi:hypothetical protein